MTSSGGSSGLDRATQLTTASKQGQILGRGTSPSEDMSGISQAASGLDQQVSGMRGNSSTNNAGQQNQAEIQRAKQEVEQQNQAASTAESGVSSATNDESRANQEVTTCSSQISEAENEASNAEEEISNQESEVQRLDGEASTQDTTASTEGSKATQKDQEASQSDSEASSLEAQANQADASSQAQTQGGSGGGEGSTDSAGSSGSIGSTGSTGSSGSNKSNGDSLRAQAAQARAKAAQARQEAAEARQKQSEAQEEASKLRQQKSEAESKLEEARGDKEKAEQKRQEAEEHKRTAESKAREAASHKSEAQQKAREAKQAAQEAQQRLSQLEQVGKGEEQSGKKDDEAPVRLKKKGATGSNTSTANDGTPRLRRLTRNGGSEFDDTPEDQLAGGDGGGVRGRGDIFASQVEADKVGTNAAGLPAGSIAPADLDKIKDAAKAAPFGEGANAARKKALGLGVDPDKIEKLIDGITSNDKAKDAIGAAVPRAGTDPAAISSLKNAAATSQPGKALENVRAEVDRLKAEGKITAEQALPFLAAANGEDIRVRGAAAGGPAGGARVSPAGARAGDGGFGPGGGNAVSPANANRNAGAMGAGAGNPGAGGAGQGGQQQRGIGNAEGYLAAARGLLAAIGRLSAVFSQNANPIVQIAKNLTNKGLSEQAIAYLEAALVDSAIQGTPTNQSIILTKAQASTIHGDAETNIAFWKETINENKQLGKQTHDLAKMA